MRVDARLLRAGVFLVALGLVPLLVQAGSVDPAVFQGWGRLWPLILVVVGIGVLLRVTRIALIGGVFVAAILGLVIGAIVASGGSFLGVCTGPVADPAALTAQQGAFEGSNATVRLALDCGDVRISTQAGNAWSVRTDAARSAPATVTADADRLLVRSPSGGRSILDTTGSGRRDRWDIVLPTGPQLGSLSATLNAASGTVDLGGAHVGDLQLVVNASSATVDLSGATATRVDATINAGKLALRLGPGADLPLTITANAGSVELCVAPGTALQVDLRETLGSNDLGAHGLLRSGNLWTTPGFDSASARVRVQLQMNVATLSLDPVGGCHA